MFIVRYCLYYIGRFRDMCGPFKPKWREYIYGNIFTCCVTIFLMIYMNKSQNYLNYFFHKK